VEKGNWQEADVGKTGELLCFVLFEMGSRYAVQLNSDSWAQAMLLLQTPE
jgi:hypothetical protein